MTVEEIRKALFSLGNKKTLGPDGYYAKFFKATWDIVASDL